MGDEFDVFDLFGDMGNFDLELDHDTPQPATVKQPEKQKKEKKKVRFLTAGHASTGVLDPMRWLMSALACANTGETHLVVSDC
jgi:hypothetical protein